MEDLVIERPAVAPQGPVASAATAAPALTDFERRKREHIQLALDERHQAGGLSGLDDYTLVHEALPEIDLCDVSLRAPLLGGTAATPFYVAGMTAGHADAPRLNRLLARACARRGWALGVGSQRRQLHDSAQAQDAVDQWCRLREEAPGLVVVGNSGLSQLIGTPLARLRALMSTLQAQALAVHLNPLQECLQPEGTPSFRGGLAALRTACAELGTPVVLKETGCGFSRSTLLRLAEVGLAALDVSGLGGTHWGRIEGSRAAGSPGGQRLAAAARTFANWGVPTVRSVLDAAAVMPHVQLWASGGVRSGLDAAKLLALGAQRVGYARPALETALQGERALDEWMALQVHELRIALFCTGCADIATLRQRALAPSPVPQAMRGC